MSPVLLIAAILAVALPPTGLLVFALRGRRIDDHPLCRSCHFDLTGLPETSTQCPECGKNVTAPGAIRIGHRQTRIGLALTSAAALALSLLTLAAIIYALLTSADLSPYKPLWWLASDLASSNPTLRKQAHGEIARSTTVPPPDPAPYLALADKLLARQANPSATWRPEMGDTLVTLRIAKILDDPRWSTFAYNHLNPTFITRPTYRPGDFIAARLTFTPRTASKAVFLVFVKVSSGFSLVDGTWSSSYTEEEKLVWLSPPPNQYPVTAVSRLPFGVFAQLKPGPQKIFLVARMHIILSSFGDGPDTFTQMRVRYLAETRPITVLPPDDNSLVPDPTPDLPRFLLAALPSVSFSNLSKGWTLVTFAATDLPANLAYDVITSDGAMEIEGPPLVVPKTMKGPIRFTIATPTHPTFSLIFRPNPKLLTRTVDLTTYANVELRFDNLTLPTPTTFPTSVRIPTSIPSTNPTR